MILGLWMVRQLQVINSGFEDEREAKSIATKREQLQRTNNQNEEASLRLTNNGRRIALGLQRIRI